MASAVIQPRNFNRDIRLERLDLTETEQFARWEAELPPSEYWLINPARDQFETPTDERGIVDLKGLVTLGKTAVRETYVWDIHRTRDDHLCWPETAYRKLAWHLDDPLPVVFRNIPPNKVRLPLEFERWKHAITIPPDFPSLEVMRYYVDAWATARDLYLSVGEAVRWERRLRRRSTNIASGKARFKPTDDEDPIGKEFIADTLAANFKGVEFSLRKHLELPPEFQIIKPEDDARRVLQVIGYQVKHRCRDGVRSRQSMFKPEWMFEHAA